MRVLWTTSEGVVPFAPLVFLTPLADWLSTQGVEVDIRRTSNLRSPWGIRRARRHISAVAHKFDVVHAQYGSACALATMGATDAPRLMTIRGNDWNLHSETCHWLWLHTRLARRFSRMAIGKADGVLAVSRRLVSELMALFPTQQVHYLPTPVDLHKFRPATDEERRNRSHFGRGANPDSCWILFNSLNPWDPIKRYRLARRAIEVAKSVLGLPVELILASDVNHDDIPALTRACDVILSTSESEGWPNCIKEALASGVPFIATDVSDLHGIASIDPRCTVVDPDPLAIARAISQAVERRNDPCSVTLRNHVQHMQVPSIGQRLLDIYTQQRRSGA